MNAPIRGGVCLAAFVVTLLLWGLGAPAIAQSPELTGLPEVNGWRLAAALLVPRSEQAVAELDGKVYAIGGYPPGRIPSAVVQVYTAATDQWVLGPPLPVPMHHAMAAAVSGGGAAVIDGNIYVAGGRPPRGSDFAVYDVAANRWTALPDVPTQRNHLAVGAIGGRVYVAGGRFGAGFNSEKTAALEIYDPATNRWTPGAPLPAPRGGVASIVANGCLFVIGGEGNYNDVRGLFDQNEAYDARANTWAKLASMPTPTHGLTGAAFVNGGIHLPGGAVTQGGGSGSVIHWVFRPSIACR